MIAFILDSLIEGLDFLCAMKIEKEARKERVEQIKKVIWKLLEVENWNLKED